MNSAEFFVVCFPGDVGEDRKRCSANTASWPLKWEGNETALGIGMYSKELRNAPKIDVVAEATAFMF